MKPKDVIIMHLRATNDTNGNARECYVLYDANTTLPIYAVKIGRLGHEALLTRCRWTSPNEKALWLARIAPVINVTPFEYRTMAKAKFESPMPRKSAP